MLAGLTTGNTPPWAVLLPAPSLATAAPAVSTAVTSDAEQQARQQQHQPQDQQQDQQQQQAQQQQGWWGLPRQQGQAKRARPSPRQGNKRCKTSQFRGVASTENGLWRCRIRFGKKTVHLGRSARGRIRAAHPPHTHTHNVGVPGVLVCVVLGLGWLLRAEWHPSQRGARCVGQVRGRHSLVLGGTPAAPCPETVTP
jgi:hypothetical protein